MTLVGCGLVVVLATVAVVAVRHHRSNSAARTGAARAQRAHPALGATQPVPLRAGPEPSLGTPVQDAAVAALDGRTALLLGGLTAADTSRADIVELSAGGGAAEPFRAWSSAQRGSLPTALHDATAVGLGGRAYLLGGGNLGSSAAIVEVGSDGTTRPAGRLPVAASDVSAAALGGSAYVVGGFTGTSPLDTIVAWRLGRPARVVAYLPYPVRYAAVAAARGRLIIAGGTVGTSATREVLSFNPRTGRVTRLGSLPSATTHAGAATLHSTVYVVGGRGATPDSPTDRIVALDPTTGRVRPAGHLPAPRSDAAVVAAAGGIIVAGGRSGGATLGSVLILRAAGRGR